MKIAALAKGKAGETVTSHLDPSIPFNPGPDAPAAGEAPAAPTMPTPATAQPGGINGGSPGATVNLDPAPAATPAAVIQPGQTVAPAPALAPAPAAPATDVSVKTGFLMRGTTAHNAVATEQAKAEMAQAQSGFRFWIKPGGEVRLSFVDGSLDQDGMLAVPHWYEHRLMVSGRIINIVCYETVADMGPCPVCQNGHRGQLVAGLTIVNHTPYTIQTGQNAGKTLQNRRQMFVTPRTALETLQKLASKRGGLATHCFDVFRKEKKDPRVGSVFDYVGQLTPEQMQSMGEEWQPWDWDEKIKLIAAGEMAQLGGVAVPYGQQASGGATNANLNEIEV